MEKLYDSFGDFHVDVETVFVGRDKDLEQITKAWPKFKVFGIFGLRSVGKSRLVKEAIRRLKPQTTKLVHLDVKLFRDFESLYINICATLGIDPKILKRSGNPKTWIDNLVRSLRAARGRQVIFVFDNTEDCQEMKGTDERDLFLSLCSKIALSCKNVKIFITSTTRIQFAQINKAYFSYEVLPLTDVETKQLLHAVADGIEFAECEQPIADLCEGLPLLILMIGSELTEDGGMITPQDMVEFLLKCRLRSLSREFYPEEDRVADVYKKFIDRLEEVYRERLTVLEYIPGSFTAEHAKDLLDMETMAMVKDEALIPIRRRHVLNYNPATRRFDIQGILKECIRSYYTIRNIPEIRARYVRIFSNVMQNISKRLGTKEYTKAMAEFTVEQPNLQKLLTEVNYTRADTYNFFIQIATCTDLIERFMAGDGEVFYQGCLKAADMYGQERDKASVHIAVGSMYTNSKGPTLDKLTQESILKKGADHYETALNILQRESKSLELAIVYQRIGWNLHMQGQNPKAVAYLEKSLAISMVAGPEYQTVWLQTMNSMGLTLSSLGRFEDAKRYHFASLERRQKFQGPDHPGVGACFNNIGVMYDLKGDNENAAKYYRKGLDIKIKTNVPVSSLLVSVSNTANMCIANDQTEDAHALLADAFERIKLEKDPLKEQKSLLYNTKGKLLRKEGKLNIAEKMFRKAIEIRAELATVNVYYMESLVNLADVLKKMKHFDSSLKVAKKALQMKSKVISSVPQNSFVKECLECMADVYRMTKDTMKFRKTLGKIETELLRLERFQLSICNEFAVERTRKELIDVRDKLKACASEE